MAASATTRFIYHGTLPAGAKPAGSLRYGCWPTRPFSAGQFSYLDRRFLAEASRLLRRTQNPQIIDISCGNGNHMLTFMQELFRRVPNLQLIMTDKQATGLNEARVQYQAKFGGNVSFIPADLLKSDFAERITSERAKSPCFLFMSTLHFFLGEDVSRVLSAIRGVILPGAIGHISTISVYNPTSIGEKRNIEALGLVKELIALNGPRNPLEVPYLQKLKVTVFDFESLRNVLESAGFEVLEIRRSMGGFFKNRFNNRRYPEFIGAIVRNK